MSEFSLRFNDRRYIVGHGGEVLVSSYLPESIHWNAKGEARKPYDITWHDINLDVKTSSAIIKDDRVQFNSVVGYHEKLPEDDIIYLLVLNTDDRQLFWLRHSMLPTKRTYFLTEGKPLEELPEAIIEYHASLNGHDGAYMTGQYFYNRFKQELVADETVSYNGDMLAVVRRAAGLS